MRIILKKIGNLDPISAIKLIKVGDTVECIDGGKRGGGWKEGLKFKVTKIDKYGDSNPKEWVFWKGRNGNGVFGDSIRKVIDN